jgi:hypothetical protein
MRVRKFRDEDLPPNDPIPEPDLPDPIPEDANTVGTDLPPAVGSPTAISAQSPAVSKQRCRTPGFTPTSVGML